MGLVGLRPYQEDCVSKCLEEYAKGIRRQAVSLPVGSGKTVVFAHLIHRLVPVHPDASKVLVLAHREELLVQAQRQIQRFVPGLRVSIEKGQTFSDMDADDVIIASVPTLGRKTTGTTRLQRFDPRRFKCIIIDEAHHSAAKSYMQIMEHFRVDKASDGILVWGCSATLSRNDSLALGTIFDRVVYHIDIGTLMKDGWLCRVEAKQIYTDVDLDKIKRRSADFDTKELSLAIDTPVRNDLVAATWLQVAQDQHRRRATIVFGLNVAHVWNLASAFNNLGVETAVITGETDEAHRKDIVSRFSRGEIPVLLNCAVLIEGTDLPITDCIVMTRPTCNSNLYTQMVGRGLRTHKDKEYCLVLDFIDQTRTQSRSLVTFPSLLAAQGPRSEQGEQAGKERKKPEFEDVNVDNVSVKVLSLGSDELFANPGFGLAWVNLDETNFVLSSRDASFLLELKPNDAHYGKLYNITKSPDHLSQKFKINAVPFCNECSEWTLVRDLVPKLLVHLHEHGYWSNMRANSSWRRTFPLTLAQRKLMGKIFSKISKGAESGIPPDMNRLSVGYASDIITRYILREQLLHQPVKSFEDLLRGIKT